MTFCWDGDHVTSFIQRTNNAASALGKASGLRIPGKNLFLEMKGIHKWMVSKYSLATALCVAASPMSSAIEDGTGRIAVGTAL